MACCTISAQVLALAALAALCAPRTEAAAGPEGFALIPAGEFEMGDHHGFVDPRHGGDETPLHKVSLGAFWMGIHPVTTREYCAFLNASLAQGEVVVRDGGVHLVRGPGLLCETRAMSPYSRIGWNGSQFAVLDGKEQHPVVCIRWEGAAAYCNWLSARSLKTQCYDTATWDCDFNTSGFRLPTEAEWEYAGRGGLHDPYRNFPWGDEPDAAKANWPESKNPFRTGPQPWTTPVGFFNGKLHRKADFGWPGREETFQTADGVNGYGLYDMAGNVWEFVNDWYERNAYAYSPTDDPAGPDRGSIMPDGKAYRGMRGGNWYNGQHGHSRVSNRNPSYYRGPQDPDHPYYHIGFRVVLPVRAESRPRNRPTPVQEMRGRGDRQGDRGPSPDAPRREPQRPARSGAFTLGSPAVADGGMLPPQYTGDGAGVTLPLEWSGAPAGTQSFALIMHHDAPDQTKWYWILYNIPSTVRCLPANASGVGTMGSNSVTGRPEYAPPQSKGPGSKTYIYTLYALSSPPQLAASPPGVSRAALLAAMEGRILATAQLQVVYSRPGDGNRSRTRDR